MDERFSDNLHRLAEPIWRAQHAHPFVRGIGDGTLDLERFAYWVRQDYRFLIDYARLFALIAGRAPDLDEMTRFATLAQSTLQTEMDLHRAYAARWGITPQALADEQPAPTTLAYVNFLLRTALLGSYGESVAALLPCMWGFSELGSRLAAQGGPASGPYAEWIAMYGSAEFAQLSDWCRAIVDRAAAGAPAGEHKRMEAAFLTSSRYEFMFWEAAWQRERWSI